MEFSKIAIFIPLLVVLCFDLSNCVVVPECTGCKKVNYVKTFPGSALEGVWYVNALYDASGESDNDKCAQFRFTKINCTAYKAEYCYQSSGGSGQIQCSSSDFTYAAADPIYPDGRFILTSSLIGFRYETFLVDIVENYYAIFYGCQIRDSQTSYQEYYVLTRQGVVYAYDGCNFAKILEKNGLDSRKLRLVEQQGTCSYQFGITHPLSGLCSSQSTATSQQTSQDVNGAPA